MRVTIGWSNRNDRYISHILGILLSRMRARSKRALTFAYSEAKMAGFNFPKCFVRRAKYCSRLAAGPNEQISAIIPFSKACRTVGVAGKLVQAQKPALEGCHVET